MADKKEQNPKPKGIKHQYSENFEDQKWGQKAINKNQKTTLESTLLEYNPSWR